MEIFFVFFLGASSFSLLEPEGNFIDANKVETNVFRPSENFLMYLKKLIKLINFVVDDF